MSSTAIPTRAPGSWTVRFTTALSMRAPSSRVRMASSAAAAPPRASAARPPPLPDPGQGFAASCDEPDAGVCILEVVASARLASPTGTQDHDRISHSG
jgi:hypothetical protein